MKYRYVPAAKLELHDATDYYEERRFGLGDDLLDEINSSIQTILKFPEIGSQLTKGCRKHFVEEFPYNLVYKFKSGTIFIVAVMHHSRKPGYWKNRI